MPGLVCRPLVRRADVGPDSDIMVKLPRLASSSRDAATAALRPVQARCSSALQVQLV